jgi:hypothetical protein
VNNGVLKQLKVGMILGHKLDFFGGAPVSQLGKLIESIETKDVCDLMDTCPNKLDTVHISRLSDSYIYICIYIICTYIYPHLIISHDHVISCHLIV